MGLKRRNPARTRLLTTPSVLAAMAQPAPAAKVDAAPAKPAEVPAIEQPAMEQTVTEQPAPAIAKELPAPLAKRRITNEERHQMIARVAYGYAERANFHSDPVNDWLAAEREIDAQLSRLAS
jgi:hypothetical protein